jgi:hypothetical protein
MMDVSHSSLHSGNSLRVQPSNTLQNFQRRSEDDVQASINSAPIQAANGLNHSYNSKNQEFVDQRKASCTGDSPDIKACRYSDENISGQEINRTKGTPLQRWIDENPRNDCWSAVPMLNPAGGFVERSELGVEDDLNSFGNCHDTHTPSIQKQHTEVLKSENRSVAESAALDMELELKGMGAGVLVAMETDMSVPSNLDMVI